MTTQMNTKILSLIGEAMKLLEESGVKPGSPEQTARAALRQAREMLGGA